VNKVRLYTNDGRFVTEVTVPPWKVPVEVYVWGQRMFILREDGRYTEASGMFWVPREMKDTPSAPVGKGWPENAHPDDHPMNRAKDTASGEPPVDGHWDGPTPTPEKLADGQHRDHWVLPESERAKGFVRPVRTSYVHVGPPKPGTFRELTVSEQERHAGMGYVRFEEYGEGKSPVTGRFWTQDDLDRLGSSCGAHTTMPKAIAETYARDPGYYGKTFCAGCKLYLPVGAKGEFTWDGSDERVGT